MMRNTRLLLYVVLLLSVAACTEQDDAGDMVEMPVYIAIPAAGFSSPMDVGIDGNENRSTRAVGDPGSDDKFELPQYIYVYLVTVNDNNSSVTYGKFVVDKSDWKLSTAADNGNDHFQSRDGLYVYQGHLSMFLPANRQTGKVYVAACNVDLEQYGLKTTGFSSNNNIPEEVTFNCGEELSTNMKNLYSTPYNLKNADNEYYGTIQDFAGNVPHLDIVLYHTAAKVDVQWQIDEDCQGVREWKQTVKGTNGPTDDMGAGEDKDKVFFSYIEATNLPAERCPLFMPMNCTEGTGSFGLTLHGKEVETGGIHDGNKKDLFQIMPRQCKGQQYNGRSVIYVIPKRYRNSGDYFIGLRFLVNNYATTTSADCDDEDYALLLTEGDHATVGHHAHIRISDEDLPQEDGSPVYTPWLRAFVHVTKDNVGNLLRFNEESQYE